MTLRTAITSGIAASVLVHLVAIGVVLVVAEVRPFAEEPEQRIEVDVVTADEAPPPPIAETKPDEPKPSEPADTKPTETKPALDLPEIKPTLETKPAETPPQPAQKQAEQKPKPPVKPPEPEPPKPQAAPQPSPQPPPQQQQAAPYPPAIPQEPDVTVKYSVLLGLPADNFDASTFDAKAETRANISADSAAALLARLKSCAALPPGVKPSDNVRIVLRVALSPDGQLAGEPMLIEASASAKGPTLMHGAMAALSACQPYTMLPADKYQEWKVLDLTFTPQDFRGG